MKDEWQTCRLDTSNLTRREVAKRKHNHQITHNTHTNQAMGKEIDGSHYLYICVYINTYIYTCRSWATITQLLINETMAMMPTQWPNGHINSDGMEVRTPFPDQKRGSKTRHNLHNHT